MWNIWDMFNHLREWHPKRKESQTGPSDCKKLPQWRLLCPADSDSSCQTCRGQEGAESRVSPNKRQGGCPRRLQVKVQTSSHLVTYESKVKWERISTYQTILIPLTYCMLTIYCSWLIANNDCELCTHLICIQYSVLWENNLWSDEMSQMFFLLYVCVCVCASRSAGREANVRHLKATFWRPDSIIKTWYSTKRHERLSTCYIAV